MSPTILTPTASVDLSESLWRSIWDSWGLTTQESEDLWLCFRDGRTTTRGRALACHSLNIYAIWVLLG